MFKYFFSSLVFVTLMLSVSTSKALTDQEILAMNLYQLEELDTKKLERSQRKIVRKRLKDKTLAMDSCEALKTSYYEMPYQDLMSEGARINSKTQKKLYDKIYETRTTYEELKRQNKPRFSVELDEFSGTTKFKTSIASPVNLTEGDCPKLKKARAWKSRAGSQLSFFRGSIMKDGSNFLQIYFQRTSYSDDAMSQYYGIRGAIPKSLGIQKDVTSIDLDYSVGSYLTTYYMDFAITITSDELETIFENGDDEVIKIYSNAGDFLMTVERESIEAFYNGMKNDQKIASHFFFGDEGSLDDLDI